MALKNLKSDLSQVNKPLKTDPMVQRQPIPSVPNTTELGVSKFIVSNTQINESNLTQTKTTPTIDTNKSKYGVSNNITTDANKYKPKTLLELYAAYINNIKVTPFSQTDNKKPINLRVNTSPNGSLNTKSIVEVFNGSLIFGREMGGVNVFDNIKQSQKLGLEVFDRSKAIEKIGQDVFDRSKLQQKSGVDVQNQIKIVNKNGLTIKDNMKVATKLGIDVKDNTKVAVKLGTNASNNIKVIPKTGLDVQDNMNVATKTGLDVSDNMHVAPKTGLTVPTPISIPKPSIADVTTPIAIPKESIVDTVTPDTLQKPSIANIPSPRALTKESIDVPNNQSAIDSNKISMFAIDSMHMPTGMQARLFSVDDVPYRSNDLKLNEGFNTTVINNASLSQIIDAEYKTTPSFIDGMQISGKRGWGYDSPLSGNTGAPRIKKDIGKTYYGSNGAPTCAVELIRGGIITHANRILEDVERIGGWLASPCGLLWIAKQQAYQLTNPLLERPYVVAPGKPLVNKPSLLLEGVTYNPVASNTIQLASGFAGLRWNRIYNPLSTLAAVAGQSIGIHPQRHGVFGLQPGYEDIAINNNKKDLNIESGEKFSNRMLRMWSAFELNKSIDNQSSSKIQPGEQNPILSGWGGPNTLFGLGSTDIYTSKTGIQLTKFDLLKQQGKKLLQSISNFLGTNKITGDGNNNSESGYYHYTNRYSNTILITGDKDSPIIKYIDANKFNPGDFTELNLSVPIDYENGTGPSTVGISPLISNVDLQLNSLNPDVTKYNTLRYQDLGNYDKHKVTNNKRGEVEGGTVYSEDGKFAYTQPIKNLDPIKWSQVGKFYQTKYGDKYKTLHGPDPILPDTGETDFLYFTEGLTPKISNDLITLLICNTQFRALLKSLSYRFNPDWSDVKYIGRPDKVSLYGGVDRGIDFSFIVAAGSEQEMGIIWKHLNELGQKVSPIVQGNRMVAPIYTLTIGNFVVSQFGFLNNLTYTIEEDYIWDIDNHKLPMYVSVDCGFTIIGRESPSKSAAYFATHNYYNRYQEFARSKNAIAEDQKIVDAIGKETNPNGEGDATGLTPNSSPLTDPKLDKKQNPTNQFPSDKLNISPQA